MKNIILYFNDFQSKVQIVNSYQELVRLIDNEQMKHIKVNWNCKSNYLVESVCCIIKMFHPI